MKGLFLYTNIEPNKETSGEAKKVAMQVDALNNIGLKTKLVEMNRYNTVYNKILNRIPMVNLYSNKIVKDIIDYDLENINYIYIRKFIIDKSFLKMLKKIKLKNNKIKILLEIPTYPYDLEWNRKIDKPLLIKEKLSRKKLNKYVDRIITFSNDDIIFGVPTIKINNGIDLSKINTQSINKKEKNCINLIGVALLAKWHGYDRIIQGLKNYYDNQQIPKEIKLNIVGEGSELNSLKKLVKQYKLEDKVIFYGKLFGEELEKIYNKSDIAIGSLGMHRIGMKDGYTLKLREYCARGIPFIKSYYDKVFDESYFKYMINFPCNDCAIDMSEIIRFYEEIKIIDKDIRIDYMREFAKENLTWEKQMKKIDDYIVKNYNTSKLNF
ncbi:glycosyltransferase [Paraclostridium bifermentans]|uniref:glycosyltransferase n=1 Tax=Paraclostridium bifermentans TaxID=1490 RepID=UPI0018AC7AD3|nr:glycosyltransferase [Paraclostridium bifermentans]